MYKIIRDIDSEGVETFAVYNTVTKKVVQRFETYGQAFSYILGK
jgi:hypothetical protein